MDYLTTTQKKNLTKCKKAVKYLESSLLVVPNTLYNKRLGDKIFVLPETLNSFEEALKVIVPEVCKIKGYQEKDLFNLVARVLSRTKQWNIPLLKEGRPARENYHET